MADFHGQTVDLHQGFEAPLGAGWTETDPDNNVNPQDAAAKYAGSYGASFNLNGNTAGGESSYLGYDIGGAQDPISAGFWFYAAPGSATFLLELFAPSAVPTNMGTYCAKIYYARSAGGDYAIRWRGGSGFSDDIAITSGAWYWITVYTARNATSTINVYTAAHNLVDTKNVTGFDNGGIDSICFGVGGSYDQDVSIYFDDVVVDWTDATFPLLGWTVGGGISMPLVMLQHDHFSGGKML